MEIFQPWQIKLARVNIADKVDLEALTGEIHTLHCLSPRESAVPHPVTEDQFPLICALRDGLLTDLAKDYIKEAFGVEPENMTIDTFGKWFTKGEALGSHLHGNSLVTSVFYPATYGNGMTMVDPRFNASRGYPRSIRDNHFGDHVLRPVAGDVFFVPSYVQHSIAPVGEDLRVSLINDFFFQ
jgi:hypothetical protein